ncbi:hypothetical protein R5R35_004878 [Gryllus longicercus]|uniref:Uncharacterized protein n=1 Tax=Gryllus longicercus TaxID=2509291 RepID=A0AAN9VAL5_9ORTH
MAKVLETHTKETGRRRGRSHLQAAAGGQPPPSGNRQGEGGGGAGGGGPRAALAAAVAGISSRKRSQARAESRRTPVAGGEINTKHNGRGGGRPGPLAVVGR